MATLSRSDWDRTKAGMLLQRAGFGGTPEEVDALAALSPAEAADYLLGPSKPLPTEPPAFLQEVMPREAIKSRRSMINSLPMEAQRVAKKEVRQYLDATQNRQMTELRGWWLKQMADPARAAREKLTLFLHGHFATSFQKVRSPYLLYTQNSLFREKAYGPWSSLVLEVAQDPAMLIYLDGSKNRAEAPNENFARELFELFLLGEGNYTETDILESARAFTGWTIGGKNKEVGVGLDVGGRPSFINKTKLHDQGTKTIFNETGNFDGADVVRLALAQKSAPRWITQRLWRFYAGWSPPEPLQEELVREWQSVKGEIKPFLLAMWTNPNFYDPVRAADRVKSPSEWLVGLCRQVGGPLPTPALSAFICAQLGQNLFEPPNVKGWDGGIAWINTASLTRRYEYGSWIVNGTHGVQRLAGLNMIKMAGESGLLKIGLPDISPEGVVIAQGVKDIDVEARRVATDRMRQLATCPPAPVDKMTTTEQRQDPEKLFAGLAIRFLPGETIPSDLRQRFQQAAGDKVPLTDVAIRKMLLSIVQSAVYQVT